VTALLREEAEAEILEAFRWYEVRRTGLGEKFIDEVDAAFARAAQAPTSFPLVYRDLRRIVLRRFPYLVYFLQEDDVVLVIAVLHGRGDPKILRRRAPA
jgi:plasmid stabilization system protein ParE